VRSLTLSAATKYGWNLHIWDIPVSNLVPSRETAWAAQFCFLIGTSCTKISILLFYRRLTSGTLQKTFLYVIYAIIAFIIAYAISFGLVLLVGCHPLDAYWYSVLPTYTEEHYCYDEGTAVPAAAITSVITDFVVVSLPCYVVWGMRMPIRQKLSLFGIFGVGLMYGPSLFRTICSINGLIHLLYSTSVCVAGIVRTVYIWRTLNETYDETWVGYTLWLWTAVETDLAIICACAPALKPFFKRYLGGSVSESGKGSGATGAYTLDIEASRLTNVSGEIRKEDPISSRKSYDKSGIVTLELSMLEGRVSEAGTDDGDSAPEGYTSTVGSTRDLNGHMERGKALKLTKP